MRRALFLLCLLAFVYVVPWAPLVLAAPTARLSEEQLGWAAGRTLRVGSDPSFAPFSFIDADGTLQGVDAKLLEAIAGHTGLKFQSVPYASWTEAWEALMRDELDLVTGCAETPSRLEKALFTQPYAHPRLAIITRADAGQGWSTDDLAGLTVAIPRSYAQLEDMRERIPNLRVATCSNLQEALQLVLSRQADATIMSLTSAVTLLPQSDFQQLRVSGFYDGDFPLRLAVRRGLPELVPILNIAMDAVRHQSGGAAYANWIDSRLDEWADQGRRLRRQRTGLLVLGALATALAATTAVLWWRARRHSSARRSGAPSSATPATSDPLLECAFDRTSIPMLVVRAPDLILDRNATARTLFNGTMVLPPELSAVAARLAALPPETPEIVSWGPPGQTPVRWQARLLPLPEGRSLLTLMP